MFGPFTTLCMKRLKLVTEAEWKRQDIVPFFGMSLNEVENSVTIAVFAKKKSDFANVKVIICVFSVNFEQAFVHWETFPEFKICSIPPEGHQN